MELRKGVQGLSKISNVLFHNLVMDCKYFVILFYAMLYIFNVVNLKNKWILEMA